MEEKESEGRFDHCTWKFLNKIRENHHISPVRTKLSPTSPGNHFEMSSSKNVLFVRLSVFVMKMQTKIL